MEWNIQARAHACQSCGKPFADKQPFHTLLFDAKKYFERMDVCEPCWTAQHSQATERKGFVSHWQSVYVPPPVNAPDPIQKDTAESILRKLVERNDPQYAGACYILAVMLERKRILKVKAQHQRDGQRVFIYEHSKTGDLLTVPDPNLQFDQLDQVQKDIDHLLEHGLDIPAGANSSSATAPASSNADATASPEVSGEVPVATEIISSDKTVAV